MEKPIFETYHLTGDNLQVAVKLAQSVSVYRFDTASIYGNEKQLFGLVETTHITSKIYNANNKDQLQREIKRIRKRYNGKLPSIIFLRRPMPHECWEALCKLKNEGCVIEVSNYSIDLLEKLLDFCGERNLPHSRNQSN